MLTATQLPQFYPDLRDERFESAFGIVHQRYSTNTFPMWRLAQPFRILAHNGEINTLRGNITRMHAREARLASELFGAGPREDQAGHPRRRQRLRGARQRGRSCCSWAAGRCRT